MVKFFVVFSLFTLAADVVPAQNVVRRDVPDTTGTAPKPAWFSRHDLALSGVSIAGVGLLSLADERVAQLVQRQSPQDHHSLKSAVDVIQAAGDPGALLISSSLFVVGKLTHHPKLASASLHSTEAIVASGAITQVLKLSVGRARPNISHDSNSYIFHPFHGSQTDFNSFPSGHTTAAFAAATVFSTEIRNAHPHASKFTTPLLYGLATAVGCARIYNDRHWLSDVVGGALIGHFVGRKITSHLSR